MPLTEAQVREVLDTDLSSAAVTRLINDADRLIVDKYGPHTGDVTEVFEGGLSRFFPSRLIGAVISITEVTDESTVVLAANDYRLWWGGRSIERLSTGTYPGSSWGDRVTIVYTPVGDAARRERIELDLVKLAARYEPLKASTVGDYSESPVDYEDERERLLGELTPAVWAA